MTNFSNGSLVALQGILIVFTVLVVLMLVLQVMKLFAKKDTDAEAKNETVTASENNIIVSEQTDDDEIIAVISAAVAAMSGDDVTKRLRVMSIKRQGSAAPLWSATKK